MRYQDNKGLKVVCWKKRNGKGGEGGNSISGSRGRNKGVNMVWLK